MRTHFSAAVLTLFAAWPRLALAVDAVTGASVNALAAGTQDATVWITGVGFVEGLTVSVSGDGVTPDGAPMVVQQEARVDGGRGDGIIFKFDLAPEATPGVRDITVTNPDGASATGAGIFRILPAVAMPPPPPPDAGAPPSDPGPGGPPPVEPPPQEGSVDVISRASPPYGAQGDQVNLWIVGRTFVGGATVSFSAPGLAPAEVNGRPLPVEVVRRAESEGGKADGIQYFLRIAPEAALGPVDVTVTNPDGSSGTGRALFQVIAPGQMPPARVGEGDVQAVSGASPRAVRAGRNVSMWIWGKGFATGAQVAYSSPAFLSYAEPAVVEVSQSHPGYGGIRSFLTVDPAALPGVVDVTVVNPNGTRATGTGLVTIIDAAGTPGAPGQVVEDTGPCPDETTSIESLAAVQPAEMERGGSYDLAITGRAFACGASVVIPGGGLRQVDTPRLVRDVADPLATTLIWAIEVTDDATLGPREVTVVNPNNTSKTLPAAFEIVEPEEDRPSGVAFCQARPGAGGSPFAWLALALPALLVRRRRRG